MFSLTNHFHRHSVTNKGSSSEKGFILLSCARAVFCSHFSHRKLLILAVPKLRKKCQQRRCGKNSHPAEHNFFLSHIRRSQETLKYNPARFPFAGVIQLLQHSPWDASPVVLYPSPCLDPSFQRRPSLGRKQEMEPFSWQVLPKTTLQGFFPTFSPKVSFFSHSRFGWL